MHRRDFLSQFFAGTGALWAGSVGLSARGWAALLAQQQGGRANTPSQLSGPSLTDLPPQFNDYAEVQEAKYPLLAGRFDEALKMLLPHLKDRPGTVPYVVATIYLRMEQYGQGIPYALEACRDVPTDIRYRWMLRALTMMAGRPEESIPAEFRIKMPAAASSPFRFEDVTTEAGAGRLALGRGAAWGDFDNDGREDILVGAERAPFQLLRNLGNGKFEDVAAKMGLVDPVGLGCYAAQFIDYDNDGYQDVFLSSNGWGGGGRLFLFHNDGGERFTDVTNAAGVAGAVNAFGSSWADYDNDGRADLAVATGIIDPADGDRLRLFHNEGSGKFREVGLDAGLTQKARWISVCWGDYDGDGRQDLLANSYDAGPFLFRNAGNGKFVDVSERAGVRNSRHAYTAEFFDYDNDGRLDLFVSTYPDAGLKDMIANRINGSPVAPSQQQLLFHNNGDGTFTDVTGKAGITGWYGAMSSQVGDLDNDGFSEIVLGTGNPELDWTEPKALFHNDGKGHFVDIAASARLIHFGMLHGTAFSDYDHSGNLSLFGSFGGFYWGTRETSKLYRNLGSGNDALEVRLVGTRSNRDAIGARVCAIVGSRKIYDWVNGGNGFGSLNSRIVHIGTGRNLSVDILEIDWPSGTRQSFRNVSAGQRVEVIEGRNDVRPIVRFGG
jgi:ASPIC and UnbV/FG-GAP-like repeat